MLDRYRELHIQVRAIWTLPNDALREREVREQIRSRWTNYCTTWNRVVGMPCYHKELDKLWFALRAAHGLSSDDYWKFCAFMGRNLPQKKEQSLCSCGRRWC